MSDVKVGDILLSGEVFVKRADCVRIGQPRAYQLEAVIGNSITRLEVQGNLPAECFDKMSLDHDGQLKVLRVVEVNPPQQYELGCKCGYRAIATDIHSTFEAKVFDC